MDVVEQINAILSRATQDFDGRDDIMRRAANRIAALESKLADATKERDEYKRLLDSALKAGERAQRLLARSLILP